MPNPDSNTSASGGYLRLSPSKTRTELEDIIQELIVGITGLAGALVRPAKPAISASQPAQNVDWAVFDISRRTSPNYAQLEHKSDDNGNGGGEGYSVLHLHEDFTVLVSFMGPGAENFAVSLRDGLHIKQNREALFLENIAFVEAGELVFVPEFIKTDWRARTDLSLSFRRGSGQNERKVAIKNIEKVQDCLGVCTISR